MIARIPISVLNSIIFSYYLNIEDIGRFKVAFHFITVRFLYIKTIFNNFLVRIHHILLLGIEY